ncbi:MAG: Na+/H+ antiporter subunit E [Pseudobdellovibrionaceae bacterium]|jgi:multicomponent Na+:H+ antiporter subunit E
MKTILKKIKLLLFFSKELVLANVQVALWVFKDKQQMKPAIIKMPLKAQTDLQITLLTSLITLTPGTLSLEVSDDKKFLWFHCLHTDDIPGTIASVQEGFEDMILEAFP